MSCHPPTFRRVANLVNRFSAVLVSAFFTDLSAGAFRLSERCVKKNKTAVSISTSACAFLRGIFLSFEFDLGFFFWSSNRGGFARLPFGNMSTFEQRFHDFRTRSLLAMLPLRRLSRWPDILIRSWRGNSHTMRMKRGLRL